MGDRKVLDSWKEIAEHLRRNVRTCQRWEAEMGLPVHRLEDSPRARVFAYSGELDRWMTEKSSEIEALQGPAGKSAIQAEIGGRTRFRNLVVPAIVVLVFAVVFFLWRYFTHGPISAKEEVPTGIGTVAILDFADISHDPNLAMWRQGLPEVLTQSLAQSRHVNVVPRDRMVGIMKKLGLTETASYSTEDLRSVARESTATHVATGSLRKAGNTFTMTLSIFNAKSARTGNPLKIELADPLEISSKVYVMVRQIKLDMGLTVRMINRDYDIEGREITTPFPQALKLFFISTDHLRKREFDQAIKALKEATTIDPEFAMAFRYLSAASANLGRSEDSERYMAKALELAARRRLSPREQLHILARRASMDGESVKAASLYQELLLLDPLDILARNMLAREYWVQGNLDRAIEEYETLLTNGLDDPMFLRSCIDACLANASNTRARDLSDRYRESLLASSARDILVRVPLITGDYDLALLEADVIAKHGSVPYVSKVQAYLLKGDFARAEEECLKFLRSASPDYMNGTRFFAYLLKARGKLADSMVEIRRALRESKKGQLDWNWRWVLGDYVFISAERNDTQAALKEIDEAEARGGTIDSWEWYRALIHLRAGEVGPAGIHARNLKALLDKAIEKNGRQRLIHTYLHLMGRIALAKGDTGSAVSDLKRAYSLLILGGAIDSHYHAMYLEPLGRTYLQLNDLESARETYQLITSLTLGRIAWGEIYARSFYMLGKIAERLGDKAHALENYRRFLGLWVDADPGMAEVEDAKKRLAGLTGS